MSNWARPFSLKGCWLYSFIFYFFEYKFKVCKKTVDTDQKPHSAVFDLDLIYYMYLKLTSPKFWESKGQLLQFCLEEKQNVCLKIFWPLKIHWFLEHLKMIRINLNSYTSGRNTFNFGLATTLSVQQSSKINLVQSLSNQWKVLETVTVKCLWSVGQPHLVLSRLP